jgi:hypothetical protein
MIHDSNADCDADGNRGRDVTYEDERVWTLESAALCQPGGEYAPALTGESIPASVRQAAQDWADVEEVDDDGGDDEDDEPDYDPMDDEDRHERRLSF